MRGEYYLDWHLVTMLLGHLVTLGHWHLDSHGGAVAVWDLQLLKSIHGSSFQIRQAGRLDHMYAAPAVTNHRAAFICVVQSDNQIWHWIEMNKLFRLV